MLRKESTELLPTDRSPNVPLAKESIIMNAVPANIKKWFCDDVVNCFVVAF